MKPISRRQALQLGAVGGLGVAIGGIGLSRTGLPWGGRVADGDLLVEPEVLRSSGGLLQVDLVAARREVTIAGRQVQALTYGGTLPGRTWWVRPGDTIEVQLRNELDTPTNLHTHGLQVSPSGNSDNPFLSIDPGQSFGYRFTLPEDHPSGVCWYHPHRHGSVADQLFGGLYGALIVEDEKMPVSRERVLVVSDISLTAGGQIATASGMDVMMGREGDLLLVNGQHRPHMSARPGERERWRVINACTSRYLRLALPGQRLELLGIDGGQEQAPREVRDVLLAPGNRADLLVSMSAGSGEFQTLGYDRGGMGMGMGMMGGRNLSGAEAIATLTVSGQETSTPDTVPVRSPVLRDLREQPVARRREIAFTMGMGSMMRGGGSMMDLGFDGRTFDIDRVDQRVAAGAVEEWLITNPTPMDHPFHLHVWPMQVIETDGQPVSEQVWRDVVNVPAQGRVRVLIDFARHPGRTVYHCHILDHEDAGMMAIVDVG